VTRDEQEIVAKASGELGLIGADGFDFHAANMAWTGTVQYQGESLALNGDLKVSDVETPYGQLGSAGWSGDLSYESADEYSFEGSARIIDLRPLDMGAIGELDASAIKLSATSLSMARLAVLKANLRVERLVNGEFAFAERLPNPTAIETPAVEAAAQIQTQTKT
ncbi:MAG: hypothetical protein ACI9HY_003801, partial [Planctomycetaceae bacterium]